MDDSDVFWHHFEEVEDPRIDRTKKHKLVDILFIASAAVEADQLQKCFFEWIKTIAQKISGEVIAIDGKTVRRSFDRANEKSAIHAVSAWANENRIVLGQEKVDEKSNEITAIPKLLNALEIQNCIITIDAMGCQRSIAKAI